MLTLRGYRSPMAEAEGQKSGLGDPTKVPQEPPKGRSNNGFNIWILLLSSGIAIKLVDSKLWIHFGILVFLVLVRISDPPKLDPAPQEDRRE